jgi:hypothetical protein
VGSTPPLNVLGGMRRGSSAVWASYSAKVAAAAPHDVWFTTFAPFWSALVYFCFDQLARTLTHGSPTIGTLSTASTATALTAREHERNMGAYEGRPSESRTDHNMLGFEALAA